eukprot:scaffold18946_cov57-Cyclotella_meneghiniana.AAC.3
MSTDQSTSAMERLKDGIPPIPRRPLTVYNVFSILERQHILQIVKKHPVIDYDEGPPDQTLDPYYVNRPEKYRDVILPTNYWYKVGSNRKPRSQHKNHGIISFQDLSNMISNAWKTVTPEVKAYCSLIAGNELTKYREEQKAFKEKYGEAAYEQQASKKRKKQKSLDGEGNKKRRCDDAIDAHLGHDELKQDDVAAASIKEDELTAQEQEQHQALQKLLRSTESRSIDGLTGLSGAVAQNHIMTQRIQNIREEQERLARTMCIRELQTRRIQDMNNLTSNGAVQDPYLAHEIGMANIVYQENQRLTKIANQNQALNENQAVLNSRLMMLQQQQAALTGLSPHSNNHHQHQAHMKPSIQPIVRTSLLYDKTIEEMSRAILNQGLAMLQREARQERMIQPTAPIDLSRGASEELMRIRGVQVATAGATLPQYKNHDQHQAHMERSIQPTDRTGLSREASEEMSRAILNQELQMIQPSAPAESSRGASEELMRMTMWNLQARNAVQSPYQQQQALQGQLIQPSDLVGVSKQITAEQLIGIKNAELDAADATMRESTRIRDPYATTAYASLFQSRDHNRQQAHQEGLNQRTAPTEMMRIGEGQAPAKSPAVLQSWTKMMKK